MSGILSRMTESGRSENALGGSAATRNAFVILVSVLAWTLEVLLIVSLKVSQPPYVLSMWLYSLPLLYLLPWAGGASSPSSERVRPFPDFLLRFFPIPFCRVP